MKNGRPKNDPSTLRNHVIGVRVSKSERAVLLVQSAATSMSVSTWLREAALARRLPTPPVPEINRAQYAELARLSANLNQLTHHANSGGTVAVSNQLLAQVVTEVARLRRALIS